MRGGLRESHKRASTVKKRPSMDLRGLEGLSRSMVATGDDGVVLEEDGRAETAAPRYRGSAPT